MFQSGEFPAKDPVTFLGAIASMSWALDCEKHRSMYPGPGTLYAEDSLVTHHNLLVGVRKINCMHQSALRADLLQELRYDVNEHCTCVLHLEINASIIRLAIFKVARADFSAGCLSVDGKLQTSYLPSYVEWICAASYQPHRRPNLLLIAIHHPFRSSSCNYWNYCQQA